MWICYSLDSWSHFFCSHFYITLHGEYGMTILTTPFPSFSSESNPYSIHLLKPVNSTHSSRWNHFNWIHLFGDWIPFYSPCSYPFGFITPFLNPLETWMNSFTLYSLSPFYPHTQNLSNMSLTFMIMHWIIPTQQWNHLILHPLLILKQTSHYHTQSIHESDSRKSRNSSTTPRVFPQPLSHHREPRWWYP